MLFGFFAALSISAIAQVTTIPVILQKGYTGPVTIIFNPQEGNKGMATATKCYAHTGITIGTENWKQAPPKWRCDSAKYKMTKNTDGNWELSMPNGLYEYYNVATTTDVRKLNFVFNDGPNGNLDGKTASGEDIFINLEESGYLTRILSPENGSVFFVGERLHFRAVTLEMSQFTLHVFDPNDNEFTYSSDEPSTEFNLSLDLSDPGTMHLVLEAHNDSETASDSIDIHVMPATEVKPLPEGIELGINYDEDNTKVTLCTFAAGNKEADDPSVLVPAKAIYVIGDFNNWTISPDYQMYRDSCHFWFPIQGLVPQKEYAYQYVVVRPDGVVKYLSDGFAPKQLHPDDKHEPKTVDPDNYMPYPSKAQGGYVSVFQTDAPEYEWSEATLNFVRPDKNNLVIYELWVYDYTKSRSFEGVFERLDYLQNLGVNAIEFMPLCEFDGNYNWGYSPNHYFSVDKAYGSSLRFKQLVDSIHARGMAVIVDMVFNHATGNNPQNKLYPYGNDLQYNPWFNTQPPHGDNVYEDWNHDFPETRKMFARVLKYWLDEYKVDGFRMDLSHGFCGKSFNPYVNISYYYEEAVKPNNAYFILEHWGSDGQSKYIQDGMLCWTGAGLSNAFSQLAMGYFTNDNLSSCNATGYVSYAESHDEERNMYKAKTYAVPAIKDNEEVRLNRVPLLVAFATLLRGSHMLWMNEELGFDYSINSRQGTTKIEESYRCDKKEQPEQLGWFVPGIRMDIYRKCAQVIRLRTELLPELFAGKPVSTQLGGGKKLRYVVWGNEESEDRVVVVGNFSGTETQEYTLPDGLWFDYLNNRHVLLNTLVLAPGEVRILTTKHYDLPDIRMPYDTPDDIMEVRMDGDFNLPYKFTHDGQVYIRRNGVIYDTMGRIVRK